MSGHPAAEEADKMSPAPRPLRRNPDFILMVAGQLLSGWGSEITLVAYPLLVLSITHSPVKAGLVSFAQLISSPVFSPVAGIVADRVDRKRVMIAADTLRAAAVGCLAGVIITERGLFWPVPVLAMVEGIGSVFFRAAQTGAIRSVVPTSQLPDAIGVQQARSAVVSTLGPPVGGALFSAGRALPFLVDAASYVFSFFSLIAVRTPFQEKRIAERASLASQFREGMDYLWRHPFLRASAFMYAVGNFVLPGLLFVLVVRGKAEGLPASEIGALFTVFSAFLLLGSLISSHLRRRLSIRSIILIESWVSLAGVCFLVWPSVYVLIASLLPQAIAMPITDSVVVSYRIAITPDRLVGRVESVRTTIAQSVYPLGPLLAGAFLEHTSARWTVAVFLIAAMLAAFWATLSPTIRNIPPRYETDHSDQASPDDSR